MAGYESDLTGKRQVSGQPTREYSVSDESGYAPPQRRREQQAPNIDSRAMEEFNSRMSSRQPLPEVREFDDTERQIMEAKRAKREGRERMSEGARKRIEMLIGMTRMTKDIEIDGNHYVVQTLKSIELREALAATVKFDGTIELAFETRKQLLARALTMVAGVEITQFLDSDDLLVRLDFIELMDHSLLIRLYNEYSALANEAQQKYALKTPEEVQEVIADLKK